MQMKKTSLCLAMGAIWALASTVATAAGVDATWRTTATHAHVPAASVNMSDLVAFDMPLHVQVALKIQNKGALDDFIAAAHNPASPLFRAKLQAGDVAANFLPSQAQDLERALGYLDGASAVVEAPAPLVPGLRAMLEGRARVVAQSIGAVRTGLTIRAEGGGLTVDATPGGRLARAWTRLGIDLAARLESMT